MLPDEKVMCHHTGFEKSCFDMVTKCKCQKWVKLSGHNPNTGELMDQFKCADHWLPLLLVENAQMQRQTGAAVESMRNEAKKAHDENIAVGAIAVQRANEAVRSTLTQMAGIKSEGAAIPMVEMKAIGP